MEDTRKGPGSHPNEERRAVLPPSYETEREGQIAFYETFLPLVNPHLTLDDILADDNDGVLNGNLLEFKLRVSDLNAALFQCIKYLSALRVKGKPVPANIVIVDLNGGQAYLYKSADYLTDIEKVYSGGASKSNAGFVGRVYNEKYAYGQDQLAATRLIKRLKETEFTRVHIDENCIVGWATSFYKAKPHARKEDFIGDDTGNDAASPRGDAKLRAPVSSADPMATDILSSGRMAYHITKEMFYGTRSLCT